MRLYRPEIDGLPEPGVVVWVQHESEFRYPLYSKAHIDQARGNTEGWVFDDGYAGDIEVYWWRKELPKPTKPLSKKKRDCARTWFAAMHNGISVETQEVLDAFVWGVEVPKPRKSKPSLRKPRTIKPSVRYAVFEKAGGRCAVCGATAEGGETLEVDHIVPVSKGGGSDIDNLQVLCKTCNVGKSDSPMFSVGQAVPA